MRTKIFALTMALLPIGACADGGAPGENQTINAVERVAGNVIAPATPGEPRPLTQIPQGFLGTWDFAREDCTNAASEGRLAIEASALRYHESRATIESISSSAEGSIMVTAGFSGEGESWTERLAYELNATGDRLTTTTEDGSVSVRMRCLAG